MVVLCTPTEYARKEEEEAVAAVTELVSTRIERLLQVLPSCDYNIIG